MSSPTNSPLTCLPSLLAHWLVFGAVPQLRMTNQAKPTTFMLELLPFGQVEEAVHVRREPHLVDRHHRLGARGQPPFDVGGIEVVGERVDVGEDRCRAALPYRVRGRDE